MKRRQFLKATASGAAAGILIPRFTHAAPFGEFPASASSLMLPSNMRATRVLEIFLYGGLSPWETLYCVPSYPDQYNTFPTRIATARASCGTDGLPETEDFAIDANSTMVKLGPFAQGLRARADVKARMRLLVHRHDLEPHEAAIPLALSGKKIGNPTLAGLGAHIQRYNVDRQLPSRASPHGYVFVSDLIPGDNVNAAVATGLHPGSARPLRIRLENTNIFTLLDRTAVGSASQRTEYDAVIGSLTARYQGSLRFANQGDPLRASRLANMSVAATSVSSSQAIAAVLDESLFTAPSNAYCTMNSYLNYPAMGLKLAAHLLTHPTEPASYACVVDSGLVAADGGGGYDGHGEVTQSTARNFENLLVQLFGNGSTIPGIVNTPGENNPAKLDLDDTLIILNTEFGRTPWAQDDDGNPANGNDGLGRNHHPHGYVTAFIGGPITSPGIVGAIGSDGIADEFVLASESRMAALLALGIWPFSSEAFGVSDVQGASTEEGAVESVTERVLGVTL